MADDIDDLLDEVETKYVDRKKFAAGSSNRHRTRLFFFGPLDLLLYYFRTLYL